MKKDVSIIVFWGAVWGLFEATIGYVLHTLTLNIGSFIWFPAAYYFMVEVYKRTGKASSIFYTSVIAAAIKLVDFLLPVRVDLIINPVASIILEGLVVFAACKMLEQNKESIFKHDYLRVLLLSVFWRALYLIYLLPLPEFIVKISPLRGVEPLVKFLFWQSAANSIIIYVFMVMAEKTKESRTKMLSGILNYIYLHPVASFSILLFSIFIQWMI